MVVLTFRKLSPQILLVEIWREFLAHNSRIRVFPSMILHFRHILGPFLPLFAQNWTHLFSVLIKSYTHVKNQKKANEPCPRKNLNRQMDNYIRVTSRFHSCTIFQLYINDLPKNVICNTSILYSKSDQASHRILPREDGGQFYQVLGNFKFLYCGDGGTPSPIGQKFTNSCRSKFSFPHERLIPSH